MTNRRLPQQQSILIIVTRRRRCDVKKVLTRAKPIRKVLIRYILDDDPKNESRKRLWLNKNSKNKLFLICTFLRPAWRHLKLVGRYLDTYRTHKYFILLMTLRPTLTGWRLLSNPSPVSRHRSVGYHPSAGGWFRIATPKQRHCWLVICSDDKYKRSLLISRTYTAGAYICARGPSHPTVRGVCALCEVYYYISLALQGRRHIL